MELTFAYEEIQRLREALIDKERQESMIRKNLPEANVDGARLCHSLEGAHRCPHDAEQMHSLRGPLSAKGDR